jgi:hypothetical protein
LTFHFTGFRFVTVPNHQFDRNLSSTLYNLVVLRWLAHPNYVACFGEEVVTPNSVAKFQRSSTEDCRYFGALVLPSFTFLIEHSLCLLVLRRYIWIFVDLSLSLSSGLRCFKKNFVAFIFFNFGTVNTVIRWNFNS